MPVQLRIPTIDEKRTALAALLASDTLARSEQLRSFLRFVCDREIDGASALISEYEIGVNALGRPANYSPTEDSSVRTRAYELRQRLHRYYSEEKPAATIRIELPKGTYVPRFSCWQSPDGTPVDDVPLSPDPAAMNGLEKQTAKFNKAVVMAFGAGFVFAAILAAAVVGLGSKTGPSKEIREAWGTFGAKDQEVLICLAAPLHYLVSPYMEALRDDPTKVPAPPGAYPMFSRYRPLPKDAQLEMQPVQKAITMGSVQGLARVLGILGNFGTRYRLLSETVSPLQSMRGRNVVLFGSPWYSRTASTLLEKTPWTLARDAESQEIAIIGSGKLTGLKFVPKHGPRGEYQEVYGLVTVMPSDPSVDDRHTIVIFSGLTSAGADGAAAFFSSSQDLARLKNLLRRDGITKWPRSYQVVVKCRTSEDAQLLNYSYQTHVIFEQ